MFLRNGVIILLSFFITLSTFSWESDLYPSGWYPGYKNLQGHYVHDFSYAGYHYGEESIPSNPQGIYVDVTKSPYNADNTGGTNATTAIQKAIDDVGLIGGGVVFLPAGKYRIEITNGKGLHISKSGVVLRGEGRTTKLFMPDEYTRGVPVIRVRPSSDYSWYPSQETNVKTITSDLSDQARVIPLENTSGFSVGDWVILRTSATRAFAEEHHMASGQSWGVDDFRYWEDPGFIGLRYYRQIKEINANNNTITINVPIRYPMKTRDEARVYKVGEHISEIGVENLTVGQKNNTSSDSDYESETSGSSVINAQHVVHSWIKNVHTYKPSENTDNFHIASFGINLESVAFMTIEDCYMGFPIHQGSGGNGYMYNFNSNECLLKNNVAENGRHNFSCATTVCAGNVLIGNTSKRTEDINGRHDWNGPSDFHRLLTHSNLVEGMNLDGDIYEVKFRGTGTLLHGWSTSQTVLWNSNLYGEYNDPDGSTVNAGIETEQWGYGYIIGTRGEYANNVINANYVQQFWDYDHSGSTDIRYDIIQGLGQGTTLSPQSLYGDQYSKRMARNDTISHLIIKKDIADQNNAEIIGVTIPQTVTLEEDFIVSVDLLNKGNTTWTENDFYHLGITNANVLTTQKAANGLSPSAGDYQKVAWNFHRGFAVSHHFSLPSSANGYTFSLDFGNFTNFTKFKDVESVKLYRDGNFIGNLTGNIPDPAEYQTWSYTEASNSPAGNYEIKVTISTISGGNMAFDNFMVRNGNGSIVYSDPVENDDVWLSVGDSTWGEIHHTIKTGVQVNPFETYTLDITLTAPKIAGFYDLKLKMFQEGFGWFGEETDNYSVEVICNSPNVVQEGDKISSSLVADSYQWIDCSFKHDEIFGEISKDFFPLTSGGYAVKIVKGSCESYSDCFQFTAQITNATGVSGKRINDVSLAPNPSYGVFKVDLGSVKQQIEVLILDGSGKQVQSQTFKGRQYLDIETSNLYGIYQVVIQLEDGFSILPLVIK